MRTNIECPNCQSPAVLTYLPATRLDPEDRSIDCSNANCDETWRCEGCGEFVQDARNVGNICESCDIRDGYGEDWDPREVA